MKTPQILFLLSLASPAAAQSLEALSAGAALPALTVPAFQLQDAGRGRPPLRRVGTLHGTIHNDSATLRWTVYHRHVDGAVAGREVAVVAEPEHGRIAGRAHGGEVALSAALSDEKAALDGTVAGRAVRYEIDWKAATVRGEAYGHPIELRYAIDGQQWRVWGRAGGAPFELRQAPDNPSAKVRGTVQGAPAELGVLHVTLAHFLTHLYLVLKP